VEWVEGKRLLILRRWTLRGEGLRRSGREAVILFVRRKETLNRRGRGEDPRSSRRKAEKLLTAKNAKKNTQVHGTDNPIEKQPSKSKKVREQALLSNLLEQIRAVWCLIELGLQANSGVRTSQVMS